MKSSPGLEVFSLAGKVAVVTGASAGLGAGIAVALAEAGSDVVLGARRMERLLETAERVHETGQKALCVETDVSLPAECERLVSRAIEEFGQVDILVNSAGVGTAYPATHETTEEFRRVLDINLMGSYWMAQSCGRVMRPGSSIVNIGSILGQTSLGMPQAAYSASKAGLIGLTKDLAQQWAARKGIRVNLVAPGLIDTEMLDEFPPGFADGVIERRVPMGRIGVVHECASVVVFLASNAAAYVTGACLPVDGGLLTS
jgi:NAD(P)-dependent dehydrogenase (short-subunit alcohol dehydrogenase family)